MASIGRYRPAREGYQPPALPSQPKLPGGPLPSSASSGVPAPVPSQAPSQAPALPPSTSLPVPSSVSGSTADRQQSQSMSVSPSSTRRRDVPPAVPSPPSHSVRTSPPHRSHKSASPRPSTLPQTQRLHPQPHQQHSHQHPHRPSAHMPSHRPPSRSDYNVEHDNGNNQPPFASQWYYTEEELASTPSVLHGLTPAEERERRAKGVNFIYQSGIAVQPFPLPQVTLFVAAVFFHRFYMRISMVEERGGIHHYKIAATALFLANKTEENCFKTKHLIIAVAKVAQKNISLVVDEQSKEYWRWRDSILTYEELMLETLTFDLNVVNPYDQLWQQLRNLGQLGCKPVREAAWAFLNDSALTLLPLQLDARDLAAASLFFASVVSGEKLDDVHGQPWWQFVRADEARIVRATQLITAFYSENPLRKQHIGAKLVGAGGGAASISAGSGSPIFQLELTRRPHEVNNSLYLDGGPTRSSGAASRDVTPMELDRHSQTQTQPQTQQTQTQQTQTQQTQSQSQQPPSTAATSVADPAVSAPVPGDSDAALKAAANNLDSGLHADALGSALNNAIDNSIGNGRKRQSGDGASDDIEEGEYESRGSPTPPPAKRMRRLSESSRHAGSGF